MARISRLIALSLLLTPFAAHAAGNFDGTYSGSQTIVSGDNSVGCSRSARDNVVVHIANNSFTRSWGLSRSRTTLTLRIGADGSFQASGYPDNAGSRTAGGTEMHGRITGNALVAEIGTSVCTVKMTLHKS